MFILFLFVLDGCDPSNPSDGDMQRKGRRLLSKEIKVSGGPHLKHQTTNQVLPPMSLLSHPSTSLRALTQRTLHQPMLHSNRSLSMQAKHNLSMRFTNMITSQRCKVDQLCNGHIQQSLFWPIHHDGPRLVRMRRFAIPTQ